VYVFGITVWLLDFLRLIQLVFETSLLFWAVVSSK
jgi:hypothetical protein